MTISPPSTCICSFRIMLEKFRSKKSGPWEVVYSPSVGDFLGDLKFNDKPSILFLPLVRLCV
jgi:hypothetical protein